MIVIKLVQYRSRATYLTIARVNVRSRDAREQLLSCTNGTVCKKHKLLTLLFIFIYLFHSFTTTKKK